MPKPEPKPHKPRQPKPAPVRISGDRHTRYRTKNRESINRRRAEQRRGIRTERKPPKSAASRSLEWQHRQIELGNCRRCGNPRDGERSKVHCEACRIKTNASGNRRRAA